MLLSPAKHSKPFSFFLAVNPGLPAWMSLNVLLYTLGQVSMFTTTFLLGRIIDALSGHATDPMTWVIWLAVFLALHDIFYRLGHICEVIILSRLRANTKRALFDHTARLSFGYFADRFAGEISHKISSTAGNFERLVILFTGNLMHQIVLIPMSAISLGLVHPWYTYFILVWSTYVVVGSWFLTLELNRRSAAYAKQEAKTSGTLVDVYGNIGMVKVYGKDFNHRWVHQRIAEEKKAYRHLAWWELLVYIFQGTSVVIMGFAFIAISAHLYQAHLITLGNVVFVSAAAMRLLELTWSSGRTLADLARYRGEIKQNLTDLVAEPAIVDGPHSAQVEKNIQIEYRSVNFGYQPEKYVLRDFSLVVHPQQKIGLVGLSGAGKTTLANLLLRFFDPQGGSITLNSIDTRQLTQEFLRSHISYISQDTSLFHDTIAVNISYGIEGATQAQIEEAARLAFANDFIKTLPKGYESVVGERGIKLSGGQRQRIAIARAILADRPVFLLDEATSALDSDSEAKIQNGLDALMKNKTVIAIAHRLSTLSKMDRIIFMEHGKIVEDGTHKELLAKNGKYAQLWNMQAGGFLPDV